VNLVSLFIFFPGYRFFSTSHILQGRICQLEENGAMERLDYRKLGSAPWKKLGELAAVEDNGTLGHDLLELVKLRASQINGCANCVNLHAGRLRDAGISEERIQLVVTWREAECFSARERAALDWTEAVTLVAESRVEDAVYQAASGQFTDEELTHLTFTICVINTHNRLAVAFRRVPGS
jgi:AhpD family alkylhydroperoxidase